ncbi:PduM family microcompartment protein [Furfurilactobacillus siliginis]|uniref:Uncharacterized protein n=1 Tax=Furfurilactobacillus siliginis TaxID=348151 RepID=A0A0R2L393_9LACO|nr:PduM family microcompartment protein [Furfurilactobacillus siliginis]KRN96223.1 hypothetical protein IV55_GL001609 [Furfurilactobacillus siliginis]GEK27852.1 hypothetical protein LSI01_01630 [Furfurilactobacillus siliginis]
MDIDQLVNLVVARLQRRFHSQRTVDFTDIMTIDDRVLVDNARITVDDVSVFALKKLMMLDEDDAFTRFVLAGIGLGTDVTLRVNFAEVNLIPEKLIVDWPVKIELATQQQVVSVPGRFLTRSDIMNLPEQAVLIKTRSQLLTQLAEDTVRQQKIQVMERMNQSCIWQK